MKQQPGHSSVAVTITGLLSIGLLACAGGFDLDDERFVVSADESYTVSSSGEVRIDKTLGDYAAQVVFRNVADFERATSTSLRIAVSELYETLYVATGDGVITTTERIEHLIRAESPRTICGDFVTLSLIEKSSVEVAVKFRHHGGAASGAAAERAEQGLFARTGMAECKPHLILHPDVNDDCDTWAVGGCGGAGPEGQCTNGYSIVDEDCKTTRLPDPDEPNAYCIEVEVFGPNICQCR